MKRSDFWELVFTVMIPALIITLIVGLIMATTASVDRLMGW